MNNKNFDYVTIKIPINRCDKCPFVVTERTPRSGYALDYFCNYNKDSKLITTYVEWDSDMVPIPDWCPFRNK